jgi:hypothetical protein
MQVLTEDATRQDELLDLSIQQARDALGAVADNDEEDSPYYLAKAQYAIPRLTAYQYAGTDRGCRTTG